MFKQVARKYPQFVTADRKQRASETFVNREADFDTVRQEIDKAVSKSKEKALEMKDKVREKVRGEMER